MNPMQNPPAIPIPAKSASDGLATASLVCGICGFILGPLTGIPAIITGHMALARAKKAGTAGDGKAIAGLILGYISTVLILLVGILAAAGFAAGNAAIQKARKMTCLASATALESSANNFYLEYGAMPDVGAAEVDTASADGIRMLHILLGTESTTPPPQNTRSVKFLSARKGTGRKSGLIYDSSGTTLKGLFDPWGGSYTVLLDTDYDSILVFTIAGKAVKLTGRRAAVYSKGPDRIAGTADDVMTW